MTYLSEAHDTRWDGRSDEELLNIEIEPEGLHKKLWNSYCEVH